MDNVNNIENAGNMNIRSLRLMRLIYEVTYKITDLAKMLSEKVNREIENGWVPQGVRPSSIILIVKRYSFKQW